jgi:hypothetical protein
MNFPDVPFDENLFASNSMLKSYWERSTNDRDEATIPDYPSEEKYADLKQQTLRHFDSPETADSVDSANSVEPADSAKADLEAEPEAEPMAETAAEETGDVVNVPEKQINAIVKPKALTTSGIVAVVFGVLAIAMLFVYWILVKTRKSGRRD